MESRASHRRHIRRAYTHPRLQHEHDAPGPGYHRAALLVEENTQALTRGHWFAAARQGSGSPEGAYADRITITCPSGEPMKSLLLSTVFVWCVAGVAIAQERNGLDVQKACSEHVGSR